MSRTGTLTFRMECGALIRGQARSAIELLAHEVGASCSIAEVKSWFSSLYHVRITGTESQIRKLHPRIEWFIKSGGAI